MTKIDPDLIQKQISAGHLDLLAKDIEDLKRHRDAEDTLRRSYNTEKTKILSQIRELDAGVERRIGDLFKSVFPGDEIEKAAIIIGGQLYVWRYADDYNAMETFTAPYVDFDEALEK